MEQQIKVLLAEDDKNLGTILKAYLEAKGFPTTLCGDGQEALEKFKREDYNFCVFDVMMPVMDGMEACTRIRKIPELSGSVVAFLTARGEDYSQIAGFEAGADDYITKPIKPKLFVSRIQALLRRVRPTPPEGQIIPLKGFTIDRDRYIVIRDGREITLARKEFELLQFLVSRADKVSSREEIFASVWGEEVVVGDRTIDVHIRRIREKLGIDSIKTIKGVGYKFDEG